MAEHRAEVDALAANSEAPSFENTIAALMPEGNATLTIRPEHIAIGLAATSAGTAGNAINGRLSSCIFLGTHTRCIVRAGTYEFEALKSVDSNMLGEGGELSLRLPPENIWLFAP